jgi:DNA anti-recombination protein RmuC
VIANLGALRTTFDRFRDDFELVGKHLTHAYGKYGEADKRLEKLDARLEQAGDMHVELAAADPPSALPRALDAA